MGKVDAAEWLLSLTTTPERAAATAGDLTQEAAGRRRLWFWWSVLRTTVSLAWRAFTDAPLKVAGVAFSAWLLATVFGYCYGGIVSWAIWNVIALREIPPDYDAVRLLAVNLALTVTYFRAGKYLSRYARGKELPAFLGFIVVHIFFWAALLSAIPAKVVHWDLALTLLLFTMLLSVLAGIDQGRKKATYAQS